MQKYRAAPAFGTAASAENKQLRVTRMPLFRSVNNLPFVFFSFFTQNFLVARWFLNVQKKPDLTLKQRRDPNGIRTRVTAVKGRCPGPLDDRVIRQLPDGQYRNSILPRKVNCRTVANLAPRAN